MPIVEKKLTSLTPSEVLQRDSYQLKYFIMRLMILRVMLVTYLLILQFMLYLEDLLQSQIGLLILMPLKTPTLRGQLAIVRSTLASKKLLNLFTPQLLLKLKD